MYICNLISYIPNIHIYYMYICMCISFYIAIHLYTYLYCIFCMPIFSDIHIESFIDIRYPKYIDMYLFKYPYYVYTYLLALHIRYLLFRYTFWLY